MQVKLSEAEALAAVYVHAEINGCTASGPVAYSVSGRDDTKICWAIIEEERTLIAMIFLVCKDKEGAIRVDGLLGQYGLVFLGAREENGCFIIKIGGPGIKNAVLRIFLVDFGLEPQNKAAKAVLYS